MDSLTHRHHHTDLDLIEQGAALIMIHHCFIVGGLTGTVQCSAIQQQASKIVCRAMWADTTNESCRPLPVLNADPGPDIIL
jgi:hypothetical protein